MSLLSRMPRDIWFLVFDRLTLSDLWLAAGVCSLWRSVVHNHPTFWRDISIHALSRNTFRSARTRLDLGGTRICDLCVELTDEDPVIVPLLYWPPELLPRLRRLQLELNPVYFDAICDMLKQGAPHMEHLQLTISQAGLRNSYSIPASIFGGTAPALVEVEINGVDIPDTPAAAFTVIMSWWIDSGHRFPHHIFSVFPPLDRLVMTGGWVEFSQRISSEFRRRFAQLTYLDLALEDGNNLAILQHLDTYPISALVIACPVSAELMALASQVQEPLHVIIEAIPLLRQCNMRSTICSSSGLVRALEENSATANPPPGGLAVVRLLNLTSLDN